MRSCCRARRRATLESLVGRSLWLPPGTRRGQVRQLVGRAVEGGPLDFAGFIPYDTSNPPAGMSSVAFEVKNVRGWLYPWSHEVWDLLAKLGHFPEVVPILVARRIHLTTFRMFKDVGALGFEAREQWFARRGGGSSIDPDTFSEVRETFGFSDAVLLDDEPPPNPRLRAFLETKVHQIPSGRERSLIEESGERWARVAPIARGYFDLRAPTMDGDDRRDLLGEFAAEVADAGLMDTAGWARLPIEYYEDAGPDWEPDYDDYGD
jgi:hypothetical protein